MSGVSTTVALFSIHSCFPSSAKSLSQLHKTLTIYAWSQIYSKQKPTKTESAEKQAARELLAKRKAAKIQASDKEKAEQAAKEETYGFFEPPKVDGTSLTAIAEVSGGYRTSEEIILFDICGNLYVPVLIPLFKVAKSKPDVKLISISVIMKAGTLVNRYGHTFPKKPYYLGTITVNSEKLEELRRFNGYLSVDSLMEAKLYQDFASGMAAKVMKEE